MITVFYVLLFHLISGSFVSGQTTDIVWKLKPPGTSDGSKCNKPNLNESDIIDCPNNSDSIVCKCNKCTASQDSGAQVHFECVKDKWYPTKESNILCARKFDHDTVKCEHNDCICKNNCKTFTLQCDTSSTIGNKIKNNCRENKKKPPWYDAAQSKHLSVDYLVNGSIKLSCKDKEYELQGKSTQACKSKLENNTRCVKKSSTLPSTTSTSLPPTTSTSEPSTTSTSVPSITSTSVPPTTSTSEPSTTSTSVPLTSSTSETSTTSKSVPLTTSTSVPTTTITNTTTEYPPGSSPKDWNWTTTILFILIGITSVIFIIVIVCCLIKKKYKNNETMNSEAEYEMNVAYMTQPSLNDISQQPNNTNTEPQYEYIDISNISTNNSQAEAQYEYIDISTLSIDIKEPELPSRNKKLKGITEDSEMLENDLYGTVLNEGSK